MATATSPQEPRARVPAPRRRSTRVVIIQPRTIWLAAAVAVGLALGCNVLSRALTVLILLFMAVVVAKGLRPLGAELAAFVAQLPRYAAQAQRIVDEAQQASGGSAVVGIDQNLGTVEALRRKRVEGVPCTRVS